MSDWPADAEHMRRAGDDPRWHETGRGAFVLTTKAWIPRTGDVVEEYKCRHHFESAAAREAYAAVARQSGLIVEVE